MSTIDMPMTRPRLPAYGLFAGLLAAAGLPVYLHAPKFYADHYGLSLAALGSTLFLLRLLDVVQDPLLGRLAERLRHRRAGAVGLAVAVMAAGMVGLLAVAPPIAPLLWFALTLTAVFSGYSFLTICFYAQGVATAQELGPHGHLRLARWRETGALLGVCAAALAVPLAGYAAAFALLALAATLAMRVEWDTSRLPASGGLRPILSDRPARRLLLIAFLNAAPVAVSSILFLFFVESRLQAPGLEGPLLLLFFLSAAAAAPLWSWLAERHGAKRVLLAAMVLAVFSFGGALALGPGDALPFALVCLASGAATGADLTLLPALFARRMARVSPAAAEGFGLWSFMSKLTLAFAAVAVLPPLEAAGFRPGAGNPPEALALLGLLYAGLPCLLKLAAIALLAATNPDED